MSFLILIYICKYQKILFFTCKEKLNQRGGTCLKLLKRLCQNIFLIFLFHKTILSSKNKRKLHSRMVNTCLLHLFFPKFQHFSFDYVCMYIYMYVFNSITYFVLQAEVKVSSHILVAI